MGTTTVDLFRSGNAGGPRMDNVRDKDVEKFQKDSADWVKAKKGGISTFSVSSGQDKEWKAPKGAAYPADVYVHNDHGDHWSWAPAKDMKLTDFVGLMSSCNALFTAMPRVKP